MDGIFFRRAPCGARRPTSVPSSRHTKFQSTRPLRGATKMLTKNERKTIISIHAPLAGCDQPTSSNTSHIFDFNPRTPCGVRQRLSVKPCCRRSYFNPRTPCGARLRYKPCSCPIWIISIHAPLAGRDLWFGIEIGRRLCISIHAPLAGRDGYAPIYARQNFEFQSTRPLRGATGVDCRELVGDGDFNPRAPCGARRRSTPRCLVSA